MEEALAARKAKAARLLCELSDVSADREALEKRRREAAAFEPVGAQVELFLDLLGAETDPLGLGESCVALEEFIESLAQRRETAAAARLCEGLVRLEAAETELASERARRLRAARISAFRVSQRSVP